MFYMQIHIVQENFRHFAYHPLLSANPLQTESVRTLRSISFFQSIPSLITLCHSLHTSSAETNDLASKYERIFSAT
jgi:hypothetical protein